jgi:hypothetical protein
MSVADWNAVETYRLKHGHLPSDTAAPCKHCFDESQAMPGTRFAEAMDHIALLERQKAGLVEALTYLLDAVERVDKDARRCQWCGERQRVWGGPGHEENCQVAVARAALEGAGKS